MKTKEQIIDFIKKQKVALVASVNREGYPNIKAMLMRKIDGNHFYFTTNTSSMRVGQYRENEKACLYFFHKGRFCYEGVMLIGTMDVLEDAKTKQDIWQVGDRVYYKNGVTDPDYCVLRFTPAKGRYYCDLKTEDFEL